MVAVTTDSPRYIAPRSYASPGSDASLRLINGSGEAYVLSPLGRVLLVLAAVTVVVAVAVASAAFGRMLDSHRGIPELGASSATTAEA